MVKSHSCFVITVCFTLAAPASGFQIQVYAFAVPGSVNFSDGGAEREPFPEFPESGSLALAGRQERLAAARPSSLARWAALCPILYNALESYKHLTGYHPHPPYSKPWKPPA